MTIADDLITIRRNTVTDEGLRAADRVEAEIARLHALIEGSATDEAILQAAEARADEWMRLAKGYEQTLLQATRRAEKAEAEAARLRTGIAQQLTPLDVATTHIQIVRRKGDEYTAEERDNVAAIVEGHTTAARSALFALLAEDGAS